MYKSTVDTFIELADKFERIETLVKPQWRFACHCPQTGESVQCQTCPYYKELGLLVQRHIDPKSDQKLAKILPVYHIDSYSESVKAQCIEMYSLGYSIEEIQDLNGIPLRKKLRAWLREGGLSPRSTKYSRATKQACIQMYVDGWEPRDIENETGVPADTITDWVYNAGVSRVQKYSEEFKQECLDLYQTGKTALEVSEVMYVNVSTLRGWISTGNFDRRQKKYSKEIVDKCLRLYKEGMTAVEISCLRGVKVATIRSWIKKAGLNDSRLVQKPLLNRFRETHERKPSGYWKDFQNIQQEIISLNEKRGKIGVMPTATELKEMDRQDILRAICKYHGGFQASAEKLRVSFAKKSAKYWHDFANLEHELLTFIAHHGKRGVMPTKQELTEAGENSLSAAVTLHGGFLVVAEKLNLKSSYDRKPRGYWKNLDNLRMELAQVAENLGNPGVVPTHEELKQMERMDLISAIAKNGGWPSVAQKIGFAYEKQRINPHDYF